MVRLACAFWCRLAGCHLFCCITISMAWCVAGRGRYDDYRFLSGLDKPVADFLKTRSNVEEWLSHVFELIDTSVENYLQRNFVELHVAFGCTGGQHRSVYCAQQLAAHLQTKYGVKVLLTHTQKNNWVTT